MRVIASIAMMAFLFLRSRKANYVPLKKKPILIYTVFLCISFLCKEVSDNISVLDNEVSPFVTRLLAYFLLCYIAYFSIDRIAISANDIKKILILLCGICVIDDIATYLQYTGNVVGIGLGMMFSTSESDYFHNPDTCRLLCNLFCGFKIGQSFFVQRVANDSEEPHPCKGLNRRFSL